MINRKDLLKIKNEEGFSLLELVVAVGILLVLTVGGLLAYNGITENARVAAVQSAADEVYTGAVAYDSNGQKYEVAAEEWMDSSKKGKDNSIEVRTWKDTTGAICAEAEMLSHDIAVKRGAGCDGVPAGGNGDEHEENDSSATAAECFEFDSNIGMITDYKEDLDECGTDVVIPNTIDGEAVVHIGDMAFNKKGLTSVVFNEGLETIGEYGDSLGLFPGAFRDNRLTSVVIPDSVKIIGTNAFRNNQLLTSVSIGNSVETIGHEAFRYNQLTSVSIGNSVKIIGEGAFRNNKLTSVVIPDSVKIIGESAFRVNQLASVSIGNSVESIYYDAFRDNQLTSVVIPDSVKTVGDYAFAFQANQLTSVSVHGSTTYSSSSFGDLEDDAITIR